MTLIKTKTSTGLGGDNVGGDNVDSIFNSESTDNGTGGNEDHPLAGAESAKNSTGGDGNGGDGNGNGGNGNGSGNDGNGNDGNQGNQVELVEMTDDLKQLATKFGGVNFNKTGDLLDKDNNVLKTKADIQTALDKEDKFDEAGNQVDNDGKIVRTKADYETYKIDQENEAFLSQFIANVGIQIKNPDGSLKKYTPDETGQLQYIKDVMEHSELNAEQRLRSNPRVNQYLDFVAKGGKDEDYFQTTHDIFKMDFTKASEEDKINMIVQYHVAKGETPEQARKLAGYSKQANELDADSKVAFDKYNEVANARRQANIDAVNQADLARKQEHQNYWNGVQETVVNKGEIEFTFNNAKQKFVIPIADRKPFFDYIHNVGKDGFAAVDKDIQNETIEQTLLIDYLVRYKKMNIADIVKQQVETSVTKNVLNSFKKNTSNNGSAPQTSTKFTKTANDRDGSDDPDSVF